MSAPCADCDRVGLCDAHTDMVCDVLALTDDDALRQQILSILDEA